MALKLLHKLLNSFFILLVAINMAGCGAVTPVQTPTLISTATNIPTNTPIPTKTVIPTRTKVVTPTFTPKPVNEPGLIVTLGEETPSPWYPGIPVFSPDGKIIALATSRIRFWDVETHQLIRELKNPYPERCYLSNALFSPDGRYFAANTTGCAADTSTVGHLFVWDVVTGDLLRNWKQEYAYMPPSSTTSWEYSIPVSAVAFLPNNTTMVFANRNSLEIRDIVKEDPPVIIDLGSKMFASQISLPSDGRFVYVKMDWTKDHDYPAFWTIQHKVQIWDVNTHVMRREYKFPEGWATLGLSLQGSSFVKIDFENDTNQIVNMETDEVRDLPYREGWKYFNSDFSLMVCAQLFGFDEKDQVIELWNTDTWRKIYSFLPNFGENWYYGMHEIAFSPDNTILAIEHQEQVSLWDIRPVVKP